MVSPSGVRNGFSYRPVVAPTPWIPEPFPGLLSFEADLEPRRDIPEVLMQAIHTL